MKYIIFKNVLLYPERNKEHIGFTIMYNLFYISRQFWSRNNVPITTNEVCFRQRKLHLVDILFGSFL